MKSLERIEREIAKTKEQFYSVQARLKDLEQQKEAVETAEKIKIIEKHKISSEQLQLLIRFSEDEISQFLKQKEKEQDGNEEKNIR